MVRELESLSASERMVTPRGKAMIEAATYPRRGCILCDVPDSFGWMHGPSELARSVNRLRPYPGPYVEDVALDGKRH